VRAGATTIHPARFGEIFSGNNTLDSSWSSRTISVPPYH